MPRIDSQVLGARIADRCQCLPDQLPLLFSTTFPVGENRLTPSTWHSALVYIHSVPSIQEVIHVLDKVSGTAHFSVDDYDARRLHKALVDQLPGYLVPILVRELPYRAAKTRL